MEKDEEIKNHAKGDKRLRAIVSKIFGERLADIGCDHGKIGINSLNCGHVKYVIASDISEKSLQKARNRAKRLELDNIEFRCVDGFDGYDDGEVDSCVVAGLGAYEIIKILKGRPRDIKKFTLAPHSDAPVLRQWLADNFFKRTSDELLIEDGYYYSVITCEECDEIVAVSEKEKYFGNNSVKNSDYKKFLIKNKKNIEGFLNKITDKINQNLYRRLLEITDSELENFKLVKEKSN